MIWKDTDSFDCGYDNRLLQAQSKLSEVHDAKQIPPAGFLRPSTLALIKLHDEVGEAAHLARGKNKDDDAQMV